MASPQGGRGLRLVLAQDAARLPVFAAGEQFLDRLVDVVEGLLVGSGGEVAFLVKLQPLHADQQHVLDEGAVGLLSVLAVQRALLPVDLEPGVCPALVVVEDVIGVAAGRVAVGVVVVVPRKRFASGIPTRM